MKEYKVETLTYWSKVTKDKLHIAKASKKEIQQKIDDYTQFGWRLISTDTTSFGAAIYVWLYFEKDLPEVK